MADPTAKPPAGANLPGKGIDLDRKRRPGVPMLKEPHPLPNTRFPPERQESDVTVYMHARPHKTFPPVFGTAVPPRGLSGLVRKAAFAYPDHAMRHWTMLLLADRVDSWERRVRKLLPIAVPALAIWGIVKAMRDEDDGD